MTNITRYSIQTKKSYNIGDIGPGGGIVFITPSTESNTTGKYFEVAPDGWNGTSSDPLRSWAQSSPVNYRTTAVSGADGLDFGTGFQNTLDIIAQGNTDTAWSAAALARSYTGNGYTDWFLPSFAELAQFGYITSYVKFNTNYYWTSTEYDASNAYAFPIGDIPFPEMKSMVNNMSVRPVRMFETEFSSSVQRQGNDSIYGSGSDGDVTISGTVTLSRDMYYNNLTVPLGNVILTNGYKIFVKNLATINGVVGVGTVTGASNNSTNGTITSASSNVTSKTLAGHTTSAITYRAGGQGGGGTNPGVTALPSFLANNISNIIDGVIVDPVNGILPIAGGSAGTTGSAGETTPKLTNSSSWAGKAGAAGSNGTYSPNASTVNAPGGKGNTGYVGTANGATDGIGGAGGAGGAGGPVVAIFAKQITGSGTIMSLGSIGVAGSAGSTGSPGTAGAGKTAYTGGQRGTSGVDLNDGHQAPRMTHQNFHQYHHTPHHYHSGTDHHWYHHGHEGCNASHDHSWGAHDPGHHCCCVAGCCTAHTYHHGGPAAGTPQVGHHQSADSIYDGGAGGNGGAAAPAVTGGAGKRGGAGGGGAIFIITEVTPNYLVYNVNAGTTADSDVYSASAGTVYVILNK